MPIDLIFVRHGQSEQNMASHFGRQGDNSLYTQDYRERHGSQHRLTKKGRQQAKTAGTWLRENQLGYFDRRYVSTYVRAMETAGLLNIDGPEWMMESLLREREIGDFDAISLEEREARLEAAVKIHDTDPFYWIPPNGESIAHLTNRLRPILNTLHRECADKRVIIVCHGEVMSAFRFILERMTIDRWMEVRQSNKPGDKIHNCQVLHYSRRDPKTGALADHLDWLRSISPADMTNTSKGWEHIVRPRFTNDDLLSAAQKIQPLFPDTTEEQAYKTSR